MTNVVRYGDAVVFESCETAQKTFLSVIRTTLTSRRNAPVYWTEVSEPDKYPAGDYIWRVVPALGNRRKIGDPVGFGERVRIAMVDHLGSLRFLAMSRVDSRLVMTEKAPCSPAQSTWSVAYTRALLPAAGGQFIPDGDLDPTLAYGEGHFLTFINSGRYLSSMRDPYGISRNGMGALPDYPDTGRAIWFHAYRSTADALAARGPAEAEPDARMMHAEMAAAQAA